MSFKIRGKCTETLHILRVLCAKDDRATDSYWQLLTATDGY